MSGDRLRELLRKAIHTAVGLLAFAIVFLGPALSALLALGLVFWNVVCLPRFGGRRLWRSDEVERGVATGIVAYPVMVAALVVIFWRRPEVAAAVWGVLAFGDGMAGILGTLFGRRKLPWNPRKSWAGTLAYALFGALGAATLLIWTSHFQGEARSTGFLVAVAVAVAVFAAWLESQPQGLDDNLTVPLPTALLLWCLLESAGFWDRIDLSAWLVTAVVGLLVNLAMSAAAWRLGAVDVSGAVAGAVMGTTIFASLGWRGFVMLGAFLVAGTAATRLGYQRKAAARIAQEGGGRRRARNAVANAGVATLAAVLALLAPAPEVFVLAFVAAFATAAGDTLSSEIGQLAKQRPLLITSWRRVPTGTDGAVSLPGTAAGIAGSLALALLATILGLLAVGDLWIVVLAGWSGNLADSVFGAVFERRRWLDNEGVNFAATLVGALVAALLASAVA